MKRSKHSLSHYKLASCDMGELVPVGLTEVLPGDSIQHSTNVFARVSPLVTPIMHPVELRIHHWFVPHRLVWENWEDFITGGPDGMNDSEFPTVQMSYTAGTPDTGTGIVGQLGDYLGVPPRINNLVASALPFRGYALIFNEWYRDQDLVDPLDVDISDGLDTTTNMLLQQIAWEKDYFTSSRPWEQKGPSITIPIGDTAPVSANVASSPITVQRGAIGTSGTLYGSGAGGVANTVAFEADLTGVSSVTVNILREAMALQRYEEARARYGSRYTEYLRYLGVRSSDARLQRPEYLGGGRQMLQFSEVLQTAEGTDPVGEMAGHGIGAMRSNRYRRFFEEHGYVFSLLSIRPKTIYMQALSRTWNRRVKEDFWQSELQHIGQQEVLNKEIKANHVSPDGVFGYQDRYDEYRRQESSVAGEFRTDLLNMWHMAREFSSNPALNEDFVTCVPTDRVFAVQDQDTMYVMARHSIQMRRLVARTGTSFIY